MAGAAAGSWAWRKAARRSASGPGVGKTGRLPARLSPCLSTPMGLGLTCQDRGDELGRPCKDRCFNAVAFFFFKQHIFKKQLIKKVTLEDGCTQHCIHSWLTRRTVLLCEGRGRGHAAPSRGDLLLDDSELFLKFTELGAVFRFIIPTLHHDFKNVLRTVLRG